MASPRIDLLSQTMVFRPIMRLIFPHVKIDAGQSLQPSSHWEVTFRLPVPAGPRILSAVCVRGGNATVLSVILQCIPLALAAITPTMILLVTGLLATRDGLAKAVGVVAGRYAAHLIIALLFVYAFATIPNFPTVASYHPRFVGLVMTIAGLILLLLAGFIAVREEDPDAPPGRFKQWFGQVGPVSLAAGNFILVFFSLRLMALVFAGSGIIEDADLSNPGRIVACAFLALCMIWPMLVPIGIYLGKGDERDAALAEMHAWLDRHKRLINVVVLGIIGLFLLIEGLAKL